FRRCREHEPSARAAGAVRPAQRSLFRLPRGVALVEADQRFPRLPAPQGCRGPPQLKQGCGKVTRGFHASVTALRFLQTSQTEFPLVKTPVNRDKGSRAILHRHEFPGLGSPEWVSGTCARKEGLRILTSPRRE